MPTLLWVSVLWFLVTGVIHLPVAGAIRRKDQLPLYLFLIFFDLAMALLFTRELLYPRF